MVHPPRAEVFQLDHVALGVWAMAPAAAVLEGVLGGRRFEGGPGAGFRWGQWSFADGERLELIEPDGPPGGFLHRFLERHGPGVHHVTFKVPSLARAAERARAFGYDVVGYDDAHPSWKEAFLHPKQAQGLVVQLAEAHPELDAGPPPGWRWPPSPPDPPSPVRVRRLVVAASSPAAARRLWQELLGGRPVADAPLCFAWPESPLAISVCIESEAAPGPRALECSSPRPRAIPEEAVQRLGIALRTPDGATEEDPA